MSPDERNAYRLPDGVVNEVHHRIIEKLYGEQGIAMVDHFRRQPGIVIPVVLPRMRSKDAEWKAVLADMALTWKKIYEENYYKSLDHRSFIFKQQDKKTLASKEMLREIKERSDKHRADAEDELVSLSAACRFERKLHADMEFSFDSREVHDDVWAVLIHGCREHLPSPDLVKNALLFWREVYEPLLGLTPRARSAVDEAIKLAVPDRDEKAAARAAAELNFFAAKADDEQTSASDSESESKETGGEADDVANPEVLAAVAGDAEEDRSVARCRPMSTLVPSTAPAAAADVTRRGRVIYVHDNLFVLFRLHQYMYERLSIARKCCLERQRTDTWNAECQKMHDQFLAMLYRCIDNEQDYESSQYEDDVRAHLGTNSYQLFTLDKLLQKLVKQLQHVLAEEIGKRGARTAPSTLPSSASHAAIAAPGSGVAGAPGQVPGRFTAIYFFSSAAGGKLIALFRYERSRGSTRVPFSDALYFANAHVILPEEHCFRIETIPKEGAQPGICKATVQLFEPDRWVDRSRAESGRNLPSSSGSPSAAR